MYRTQCVLTLLALYVGLVQSFSWDIVISRDNRLEFYNEGKFTYSANPTSEMIHWITYDPLHNRVLFKVTVETTIYSYDIATGKTQTLINLKLYPWSLVYDPARELLFASIRQGKMSIKSFLVKPGSDAEAEGNHVIYFQGQTNGLAVDSCKGYIYWTTESNCTIKKVQINTSKIEVINDGCKDLTKKTGLTIDPQTQKIYWAEKENNITVFFNADLDGSNKKTLYEKEIEAPNQISVSKDFIYWVDTNEPFFFQLPKNSSLDAVVKLKQFALDNAPTDSRSSTIASNYAIEEQTEGNPDCKALQSLLPSIPTKPESRVSCDTCNVSVCHNYCLQGHCSVSADGQPKCRCDAGYSEPRCEVDACLGYCSHEGVCSLNDKSQPVCRCSGSYEGDRCEVDACLGHCLHEGVCSLNDKSQPVCRCSGGFEGDRCEVDACLGHCLHEGVCSLNDKSQPVCRCSGGFEGDRCEVDACLGHCLHEGVCSLNDKSQPVCRCSGGFEGDRCEVDACLGHCLHEGVCSLNDKSQPVCRCSGSYEGDRCDVSVFQSKFVQQFIKKTVAMLSDVKTKMELLSAKE